MSKNSAPSIVVAVRVFVLSRDRCGCVLVGRAGLSCGRTGVFLSEDVEVCYVEDVEFLR